MREKRFVVETGKAATRLDSTTFDENKNQSDGLLINEDC